MVHLKNPVFIRVTAIPGNLIKTLLCERLMKLSELG